MNKRKTANRTVSLREAPTPPRLPSEFDYAMIDDATGRTEWGRGVIRDGVLARTESSGVTRRRRGRKADDA